MGNEELKKQKLLAELLNDKFCEYKLPSKAYSGNDFKRIDGHWANKPDLIITDAPKIKHPILLDPHIMKPIIGIEFKDYTSMGDIINGLTQVQQYKDYNYFLEQANFHFKLSSLAFSTTNAIARGIIDKEFSDNKVIERVAWKNRTAILINYKNNFCWSFRNYYFRLDGKLIGRFGEHAKFIEY